MSALALELIEKEKRERTGRLDLGKCGLTELPNELFECVWLEELVLSSRHWDEVRREAIESSNAGPNNQITYLSPALSKLVNLSVLIIGGLQESGIIADIQCLEKLKNLKTLDLSYNRILDLSPIKALNKLQYLDLSGNYLSKIDHLAKLDHLEVLFLDKNQIKDITPIEKLSQLQYIDLSTNPIADYAPITKIQGIRGVALRLSSSTNLDFLLNLPHLDRLDLSGNHRSDFSFLKKLDRLTDLRLASTSIDNCDLFEHMINLESLDISSTRISDIKKLSNLINLEYLNLGQTLVSNLQPLERLEKLKVLDIKGINDVSDFEPLKQLVGLENLNISFNHLQNLNFITALTGIKYLDLSNLGISDIQSSKQLTKLENIDISNNKINDIRPLTALKRLKILYANDNDISNIEPLRDMVTLKVLSLSGNIISDISPVETLINLEVLYLKSNEISKITPLSRLTKIQILDLAENKLTDIRPLATLSALWSLDLGKNKIADLQNQGIEKMPNIVNLNLSNNPFTNIQSLLPLIKKGIPVSLNRFDKGINLAGVPLTTPSPERVKRGNEAIVSYFEELDRQGTETFFEAKMLLIGEGGAGKTTLVRKLKDFESIMPGEDESTRGIDIHPMVFSAKDHGKDFTMHVWDFGGQEIYHATHQFFLTKRSLYLLVIDNRKEENYDYWLQVQKLYGENSPLIVVQNEKGGRKKELPLNEMRERFPNIRIETFAFDFKLEKDSDRATLKSLKEFIEETIQTLPHIGEQLPRQWAEIRKAIVALAETQPLISREQYYSLCIEHGIPEEERALNLSEYLHDFGAFLHFQDDVLLAQTLFLQNDWVTNGVYALIDGLNNRNNKAKWLFDEHIANLIWDAPKYRNKVAELIALIEEFELCYEVSKKQYLIPQLLPGTRPMEAVDQSFKRTRSLQLRYQYSFMPKGLLSRLMVRLHRFIKTQDAIWNSGMLLYHPTYQSWAEIVETYGEREIRIWVKEGSVREFATVITDEINLLNEAYGEALVAKRFLPCICHTCRNSELPYFYDRSALELRRERGKPTIECPNSYEDVNVQQIIEHVFVTPKSESPLKVFISYSKSDEIHKRALLTHLGALQRNEHLITWDDTRILPGEDWNARIRQEISTADIVLALLSPDALATDYIWGHEIEKAVEQSASGKSTVIPVIVRPCDWGSSPLGRLSGLPRKAKPITSFVNTDEAWQEVIEGIRDVVKQIKAWR